MERYALLSLTGIVWDQVIQRGLHLVCAWYRQRHLNIVVREQADAQRTNDQQRDQEQHEHNDGRPNTALACEHLAIVDCFVVGLVIPVEEPCHDQANANTKDNRENNPRRGDVHSYGDAGVSDRQDVDGWAHKQEGDRRP